MRLKLSSTWSTSKGRRNCLFMLRLVAVNFLSLFINLLVIHTLPRAAYRPIRCPVSKVGPASFSSRVVHSSRMTTF
jgi:hypothetical protein